MADIVCNIAKGRVAELYNRVDTADPANSALILLVLATTGLESDATLRDKATVADLVSGTTNEATNAGYARKTLTGASLAAFAADNTNDRVDLAIAAQTWTAVEATGGAWSKLVVAYDPDTTAGTDSTVVPLTIHDFVVTPDGTNIVADPSAGFYRAS